MFATGFTATTTFQRLSDLLEAAGLTDATSNSVTSDSGYIKNNSSTVNLRVGYGASEPTDYAIVTPVAALLFNAGMNTNNVWLRSASATVAVDFVEGVSAYENPAINGVIGSITLTDDTVPKGSTNNLVDSAIVDDATTVAISLPVTSTGYIKSSGVTGVGYTTGAGGTVVQGVSKSTGVELNKACGTITMHNAALNADTTVSFTLTNSSIAATDVLVLNHVSGGTAGSYTLNAQCGAGDASINVRNITAGNLSEAIVIQFALVKGVTA